MKTKNFPQKKQERRQRAFERLQKRWAGISNLPFAIEKEFSTLRKWMALGNLRDMRTKKHR